MSEERIRASALDNKVSIDASILMVLGSGANISLFLRMNKLECLVLRPKVISVGPVVLQIFSTCAVKH